MVGRRFILQVSGHPASGDVAGIDHVADRVRLSTVLRANVRDQAALQGLLRRIHDLGLSLLGLRDASTPGESPNAQRSYEVTVDGPVGEVVEEALTDYIGPIHVSSRYSFADPVLMGEVLTRLLDRGAELEHASEQGTADEIPFRGT
jgi:hypothetical protein